MIRGPVRERERGRRRHVHPLYLRIYVHAVGVAVAVALVCFAVPGLIARHQWRENGRAMMRNAGEYVAAQCAASWGDDRALAASVTALAHGFGVDIAVYTTDGRLRSAAGTPPARLNANAQDALAAGPEADLHHHLRVAAAVTVAGRRVGYVVAQHHGSPPLLRPPLFLVAALLVMLLAVVPLSRSITRPLERLTAVARAYGAGDFSAKAETERSDEIGVLARALAEMAQRIGKLLARDKELLANVSHELRSPLTRIRVALELAEESSSAADRDSALRGVGEDLAELEQLIDDVLAVSRLDLATLPLRLESISVEALCARVVERAAASQAARGRTVQVDIRGDARAELDADVKLLRRALDNLVDNAARYSPAEAAIHLVAEVGASQLELRIEDQGIGISAEDRKRLFEPFFRADRSRARATGGLGLGLVLTRRIVEAHHGALRVDSEPGSGTTVTVVVPREQPHRPAAGGVAPAQDDRSSAA